MTARHRQLIARIVTVSGGVAAAVAIALLSGCATEPYATPPQITDLQNLRFVWLTNDGIRARCGADKFACATRGSAAMPFATIFTERPTGFDDERRVCTLGHEVLHTLGAKH